MLKISVFKKPKRQSRPSGIFSLELLRLQFDQSLVPLHLRKLALGEADVLEDGAPGDADIPAEAALQTGFDVLGTATFVQSELRVSAEVARLEPRRTDQHARPAAYAGAVPFHRWDGSGLDYENAVTSVHC